jgi:hypothetical protein
MWRVHLGLRSGLVAALFMWSGLAAVPADPLKDESGRGKGRESNSYFHEHGYSRLGIPEGHLPPPGECRVWFPGRPPGHQPPPGKCQRLRREVPAGAWLLHRPLKDHHHVEVSAYDRKRPGIVLAVGLFRADTGIFVQVVGSR